MNLFLLQLNKEKEENRKVVDRFDRFQFESAEARRILGDFQLINKEKDRFQTLFLESKVRISTKIFSVRTEIFVQSQLEQFAQEIKSNDRRINELEAARDKVAMLGFSFLHGEKRKFSRIFS